MSDAVELRPTETVEVERLRPHPRNYREHPEDQLRHIEASLRQHGVYRNVVVASDDVILAGHGVVEAARNVGLETLPVIRVPIGSDEPQAIKILTADNELTRFAFHDDRQLAELLREIRDVDELLGTGYDDAQLANLLMVTRPASEIADLNAAAEWAGMPEFEPHPAEKDNGITIYCDTPEDRDRLVEVLELQAIWRGRPGGRGWVSWYPPRPMERSRDLLFEG